MVYDEVFVQVYQVVDEGFLQQVVVDGDVWGWQVGVVYGVVDEGWVYYDIVVVGDEQVGVVWFEVIDFGVGDVIGGFFDGVVDVGFEFVLQCGDVVDVGDFVGQVMGYKRFEQLIEGIGQVWEVVVDQGVEEGVVVQEVL